MLTPNAKCPSNCVLPGDVILDILLRLPVKILLRFKCVCKQWCALIGSPVFVNQHFSHESNQERLLVRCEGHKFALYGDELCSKYEEPDHLQMPYAVDALMGPVNGVFFVVSESKNMALWNPAMRQFKPLPSHHLNVQPHLSVSCVVSGFGLDQSSGDYKVVSIMYLRNEEMINPICPPVVSIYNSGTDSWRHFTALDLVNLSNYSYRSCSNTYTNGVYYRLMVLNDDVAVLDDVSVKDVAILALDMSSEKFQVIEVPDCIKFDRSGVDVDLALYGDSIALLSYDDAEKIDKCSDVWVMKNEGCWSKIYTVGPLQGIVRPLGIWKNNELLLRRGPSLLTLYNISAEELMPIEVRIEESDLFEDVFSYKESLVSIKGVGGNCKLWDASSDFVKDFFK